MTLPGAKEKPLLLLVDDDEGLLRLMEKTLRREGYRCLTATNATQLHGKIQNNLPDLVVLDLNLPDVDGHALIFQLREWLQPLHFIVITGHGDEKVAVEMMKSGATDYLVKDPQFLDLLPTVVERALQKIQAQIKLEAAEEAYRQENAFNEAILNTTGALILILDTTGGIVKFNRACEQITGFRLPDVLGKPVWKLFLLREEVPTYKRIFANLLAGRFPYEHEHRWLSQDGQVRVITWTSTGLRNRKGEVEYIVSTGIDSTERKRLEKEILEISDREQQRIGHDLHDGLCQHLASIELSSQVLEQRLANKDHPESTRAGKIAESVREAIKQTRMLARGLSPVSLEDLGLELALQELASNTKKLFGIECKVQSDISFPIRHQAMAIHLYRIAQEAINNALKHGKARKITISLNESDETCTLTIQDDGSGFARQSGGANRSGMGLRIMRYRAGMIGGTLSIRSGGGTGTIVDCTFRRIL